MNTELIRLASDYVTSGYLFWGSMGFTSATAMLAGVLIYEGNFNHIKKGLASVLSFSGLLFTINASRVAETVRSPVFLLDNHNPHYAYAGLLTLFFTTIAWVFGLLVGTLLFKRKYGQGVDSS